MKILITGGAGFIGTHLTRHLLAFGHEISIVDNFLSQVHANGPKLAGDIAPHVRLIEGDVADTVLLHKALQGQECVVHLAAETGTGQSMYEISRYERTNMGGSAALYECLAKTPDHRIARMVVASSRAIYGEGAYRCAKDEIVYPVSRTREEKLRGEFDPVCPICGAGCEPIPTPESAPFQPSSFYGLTKQMQEQAAILFGQVLSIPTFALRYQNVYGPGQSLNNPYTGILAIFSNLARTGRRLQVFEDGLESRDFVYVEDVVQATAASLTSTVTGCHTLNVGSNQRTTVMEVANEIDTYYGGRSTVEITGAFRDGDIRHGMADLRRTNELLGYSPQWSFREGLHRFLEWANESSASKAGFDESLTEMKQRGLFHVRYQG